MEDIIGATVDYGGTESPCFQTMFNGSTNGTRCGQSYLTTPPLRKEMTFFEGNMVSVGVSACLFVVAACGNLTVFITLFRNRNIKSRVNLFIMHLSIADLIVTFVMLPMEMGWHITVSWKAGDAACRILMFFRAFGFYLSSFILVTISLDRYFAILHPLSLNDADKRGKIMLGLSWSFSTVASIPQSVIFHVEHHPVHTWFTQCVTFNFFPTPMHELAYNLFNIITVYGLPLTIISTSYIIILCEISKKTKQSKEQVTDPLTRPRMIRRSAIGVIERARNRTLKMTLVIVSVFILCWTPYFFISAWFWFDKKSALKVDPKIKSGLLLFAVSNSCMDPIVYGMFTINFKREFRRCCCCFKSKKKDITPHPPEGRSQMSQRRGFLQGAYCSTKASSSSSRPILEQPNQRSLKYSRHDTNNGQSSSASLNAWSQQSFSESRANINNFMSLRLPVECDIVSV
ncbi:hypothetical protein ScPMuIL_018134 [Solemya velum]